MFPSEPYSKDGIIAYSLHPITIIAGFLGLPNRPDSDCKPSLANLFYNFIGWQHQARPARKGFGFIIIPLTIALNLIGMPFKALLNVAKLVTEFAPQLSFYLLLNFEKPFDRFLKRHVPDMLRSLILMLIGFPLILIRSFIGCFALLGNAIPRRLVMLYRSFQVL